jgi:hypothetical protein
LYRAHAREIHWQIRTDRVSGQLTPTPIRICRPKLPQLRSLKLREATYAKTDSKSCAALSNLFEIRKGNHSGLFATWIGHELSTLGKSYVVAYAGSVVVDKVKNNNGASDFNAASEEFEDLMRQARSGSSDGEPWSAD